MVISKFVSFSKSFSLCLVSDKSQYRNRKFCKFDSETKRIYCLIDRNGYDNYVEFEFDWFGFDAAKQR